MKRSRRPPTRPTPESAEMSTLAYLCVGLYSVTASSIMPIQPGRSIIEAVPPPDFALMISAAVCRAQIGPFRESDIA